MTVHVLTVETPGLGDRSYVVHDGATAVVIDPQRDIDRVIAVCDPLGLRISHVMETHIHNDYVTGGLALASAVGARYVVAGADGVAFDRLAVADGDTISAGGLEVTALYTPGHTPNHMSYVVSEAGGEPAAVFTGGSMLFGTVGRTDLVSEALTEQLTRAQYRSVRALADRLPDAVSVHPTHGFGSFCSASETSEQASTVGEERKRNLAILSEDEDAFVEQLIAGLGHYPRYYAHMAPINAAGPTAADLSPPEELDPEAIRSRIAAGEWVVDLRDRKAFARLHVQGTISIELSDAFATYFGWVIPWQAPVTLVGDTAQQVVDARRQLVRIGVDQLAGARAGDISTIAQGRTSRYEVAGFEALSRVYGTEAVTVLDVRRPDEWQAGHLDAARHIPFWDLAQRVGEVPPGEVWVYCASGFRAAIAASILERAGRKVVHIDDEWSRAGQLGLPVTT